MLPGSNVKTRLGVKVCRFCATKTPPPIRSVGGPKLLKWGLSGRGSNLLNWSDRPLTSSTPGWRRTFALGASSFWRTWRPYAHHFSADSLFHGLPMCSVFRSEPKSHKHDKSSCFLTAFSVNHFLCVCVHMRYVCLAALTLTLTTNLSAVPNGLYDEI